MRISDWSSDVCSSDLWRTVAGVPSTPITRLFEASAAGFTAGTVPTTGISRAARTTGNAMVDAVLQAIKASRGRYRSTKLPRRAGTRAGIPASLFVTLGEKDESAPYTSGPFGKNTK